MHLIGAGLSGVMKHHPYAQPCAATALVLCFSPGRAIHAHLPRKGKGSATTIADLSGHATVWTRRTMKAYWVILCIRRNMQAGESCGAGNKAAKRGARIHAAMTKPSRPEAQVFARANGVINPHEAEPSNNSLVPDILVRANNVINPHD
jgi:hypothetical protein